MYIKFLYVSFLYCALFVFSSITPAMSTASGWAEDVELAVTNSGRDGPGRAKLRAALTCAKEHETDINFAEAERLVATFTTLSAEGEEAAVNSFLSSLHLLPLIDAEGAKGILISGGVPDGDYKLKKSITEKIVSAHYLLLIYILNPLNELSRALWASGKRNSDADGRLKAISELTKAWDKVDSLVWRSVEVLETKA